MKDALIIGGGPIGSYIACHLARAGFKVSVLEKDERPGDTVCCTGIVSPGCLKEFDIDKSLVLRSIRSARVFSPSGNVLNISRQTEQACVIDRAGLNLSLINRAVRAGAEYRNSTRVTGLRLEKDGVVAEAGDKCEHRARVAVIAAGFQGHTLVKKLGFGQPGDFAIGAQAQVKTGGLDEVEIYLGSEVAPGFFGWLVPTGPGSALVGLMSRRRAGFYLERLLDWLESQGKIAGVTAGPLYRGMTLKPPRRTYGQRVIIVGDAAGQTKPLTGGGLYYGLLGAQIAGRRLAMALKNDELSAAALSGYEREWKKLLGLEIGISYRARKVYERLGDGRIERAFDIIKDRKIDEALSESGDQQFDWHSRAVIWLARRMALPGIAGFFGLPLKRGTVKDV